MLMDYIAVGIAIATIVGIIIWFNVWNENDVNPKMESDKSV